jgi:hypothetical protein
MVDITKCTNSGCPRRMKCYRYRKPSKELGQSYCYFNEHSTKPCLDCVEIFKWDVLIAEQEPL